MRSVDRSISSPSIVSDQDAALGFNNKDLAEICRDHAEFRFVVEELISGQYNDSLDEVVLTMKDKAVPRFNRGSD